MARHLFIASYVFKEEINLLSTAQIITSTTIHTFFFCNLRIDKNILCIIILQRNILKIKQYIHIIAISNITSCETYHMYISTHMNISMQIIFSGYIPPHLFSYKIIITNLQNQDMFYSFLVSLSFK